ncbi:MAG: PAS domain-containing protein, partial [Muriicola sp.]
GKSCLELQHLLPKELFMDLQLSKEGISKKSEPTRFADPMGEVEWFQWQINPYQNGKNEVGSIMIILEKVTEQMLGKDLHIRAEQMARVGGWILDLIKNKIYWSAMTKEIHDVPEDFEPNLETGINFYKEGFSRETITKLVKAGMEKGTPWDTELIVITQKGKEIWVRAKGEPEMIDGKCIRIIGTFQDIDSRKRAEIEKNKISKRLEIATNAAKIGIWDFDIVNNVLEWDDNMYKIYGIPREKFSGVYEAWGATVHPEDKDWSAKAVEDAIAGKQKLDMNFRILWPGEDIHWIHGEATVLHDAEGNPIKMIGCNWDITTQKQTEDEMQQLLNTTTFQNESLLNFAHIVSHNMRSHGSNLSMLTDFLLEGRIEEEEKLKTLKMLKNAANGLNDTIAHLNEVVQIKTESEQKMMRLELRTIVHKVSQSLEALFSSNKITLRVEIPENSEVLGVTAYVESAVLNLLTNAVKYRDPEKESQITVKTEARDNTLILHVQDNGQGIDLKKNGDKLFGMYKTFHHHPESRGIGLFITRNQIESMGGTISVTSEPGIGSTFSIALKTSSFE